MEERNLMGELNTYRSLGAKPNFSELGRRYGLNRHTVAKYWKEGGDLDDGRGRRESGFDALAGLIERKAAMPGATKRAVHEYLVDRCGDVPGYNAFTHYCRKRGVAFGAARDVEPHPRFETPPGRQLQFDWKEGLRMVSRHGEVFEFNVYTATLGWSRLHKFVYSPGKTVDHLIACWMETIKALGGVPDEWLSDNMPALVTCSGGSRKKNGRAMEFACEAGFRLVLCRPRTPQTKGKDESANRFLARLAPYDGDFEDEADLIAIIARIEARASSEPNETTGVPPAALFMREKEHLRPVGNRALLEGMVGKVTEQVVPATMLVRAVGREWSVPRDCIGKRARVTAMPGGQVRVTVAGRLVAVHDSATAAGRINYTEEHYMQAISDKAAFADADIREAARSNLELLDSLGGGLDG